MNIPMRSLETYLSLDIIYNCWKMLAKSILLDLLKLYLWVWIEFVLNIIMYRPICNLYSLTL